MFVNLFPVVANGLTRPGRLEFKAPGSGVKVVTSFISLTLDKYSTRLVGTTVSATGHAQSCSIEKKREEKAAWAEYDSPQSRSLFFLDAKMNRFPSLCTFVNTELRKRHKTFYMTPMVYPLPFRMLCNLRLVSL